MELRFSHSDVERSVRLAGENINVILTAHGMLWIPAYAGMTVF